VALSEADNSGRDLEQAVRLGIWNTMAAIAVVSVFEFLPGPARLSVPLYLSLMVPALVVMAGVAMVPRARLAGRNGYHLLFAWSLVDIVLITMAVGFTGGGRSALYLLYALTCLFVSSYYPLWAQATVGMVTAACYVVALAATGWHIADSTLLIRVSVIALVTFMGSSVAAEKDHNAAESARRASLLAAVAAAARDVNVLDSGQVIRAVINATDLLGVGWAHVSLIDEESGTWRMIEARGIPREYMDAAPSITEGIVGMVCRKKATVMLSDESAHNYVVPVLSQSGLSAVIGSPLWVDGELVGVLSGASMHRRFFGPDEVEAFELLAGVASRALEGARRFQRMSESEARTRHRASHDELTGLANRGLLQAHLREALAWNGPDDRLVALLLVDLDGFKLVNDTLGHAAGDQVLVTIASRLESCVPDSHTVGRLAGDEFAIVAVGLDHMELDRLARKLLEAVCQTSDVSGQKTTVYASIGVATRLATSLGSAELEGVATELMKNADVAMYEAKRAGKGCHAVFDQSMSDRVRRRMAIESELPRAIEEGEMTVYYQPIFDLATRGIAGFEALLRWSHPSLGQVSPSDFIPIAEESGEIISIGRWVLQQACAELQALRNENSSWLDLTMSVNLSTRQLRDPDLVELVFATLRETEVPPWQLTLEITESSLLVDTATAHAKLSDLAELGAHIALDDFGTGYSSLAYLHHVHVHSLKVDKAFVDGVDCDGARTAPALIRSIAELGDALDLSTVAEGIETEGQLAKLMLLGCRFGQGYVFSPAVPPAQLRDLLAHAGPLKASLVRPGADRAEGHRDYQRSLVERGGVPVAI
jgi:diguanylate cyclase (GGDEF)-like protein